ncbi:MAG: hypothetical protein IPJ77_05505 [Planctomycetes bacterium]|nr:hypothetical protein [Planctomycetota bacterium]
MYERYWLPLYPVLALCAAALLTAAARRARWPALVAGLGAAVFLAVPVAVAARFATLARRPDTVREAADWLVRATEGAGATVLATPQLNLPLAYADVPELTVPEWKRAQA